MSLTFVYPEGKHRWVEIPATAGNATRNMSPGTAPNRRWLVLGWDILLTAVGAANRYLRVAKTDGTNIVQAMGFLAVVTAGQTGHLCAGTFRYLSASVNVNDGDHNVEGYFGMAPFWLEKADQLRIYVNGGLAADSFSGYLEVLEIPD